jgi:hypothetical protein
MKNNFRAEVISQSKVGHTWCSDSTMENRKRPMCYIYLKEVGGSCSLKNEFWAKICGIKAYHTFKPGQIVDVELSFHVHKNSRKCSQRVYVNKISLVEDNYGIVKLSW